jgi:hypothetical protein
VSHTSRAFSTARKLSAAERRGLIEAPGSATLDDTGHQRMASLQKAMTERPHLELDVPMTYSPDLDRPALAQTELQRKLVALKQKELGSQKKAPANPVDASALTDPAEHFRLLAAEYRQELGKDTALPDSALAVEAARKKKGEQPAYDPAIADLQNALVAKAPVTDSDLEELGKRRAHAIQDALLMGSEIDQARVFLITASPGAPSKADAAAKPDEQSKAPHGDVVRVELALK